jgi:mannose-6-phosphate isomerase-like protein (cupin superfamily)
VKAFRQTLGPRALLRVLLAVNASLSNIDTSSYGQCGAGREFSMSLIGSVANGHCMQQAANMFSATMPLDDAPSGDRSERRDRDLPGAGMLPPGGGRVIAGGGLHATMKVAGGPVAIASIFELRLAPRYDVGAHVHTRGEEFFYVVSGTLDLLAFEPVERTPEDWHDWVASDGRRFLRGGPGSFLFVPAGTPHAFANPGDEAATVLFQSAPAGHELYFEELAQVLRQNPGRPDPAVIADIRSRHDILQLTSLRDGIRGPRPQSIAVQE